jgi:hypothetical protein
MRLFVDNDYFRAADAEAAVRMIGQPAGLFGAAAWLDGVAAGQIDSEIMLGQLLAFIRGVAWKPGLVGFRCVWPPPATEPRGEEEFDNLPEDSPWKSGPWLFELDWQVGETLASLDAAMMPVLAARWARIDEFYGHMAPDDALSLIRVFAALAKRARNAGDRLYCYSHFR